MRLAQTFLAALLIAAPAAAQQEGAGGRGAEGRQNLRTYIISNDSEKVISEIWLGSTNGGKELYANKDKLRPNHAANLRVAREECLAEVRVNFEDGSTLRAEGLNECKLTRIAVSNAKIELQTSAVQ